MSLSPGAWLCLEEGVAPQRSKALESRHPARCASRLVSVSTRVSFPAFVWCNWCAPENQCVVEPFVQPCEVYSSSFEKVLIQTFQSKDLISESTEEPFGLWLNDVFDALVQKH